MGCKTKERISAGWIGPAAVPGRTPSQSPRAVARQCAPAIIAAYPVHEGRLAWVDASTRNSSRRWSVRTQREPPGRAPTNLKSCTLLSDARMVLFSRDAQSRLRALQREVMVLARLPPPRSLSPSPCLLKLISYATQHKCRGTGLFPERVHDELTRHVSAIPPTSPPYMPRHLACLCIRPNKVIEHVTIKPAPLLSCHREHLVAEPPREAAS